MTNPHEPHRPDDPELTALLDAVDRLPRPEPRPGGRARLLARLDAEDARRGSTRHSWWLALGGAATAATAAAIALAVRAPDLRVDRSAMARLERLELAEDLELYDNLDVVEHLDVLPDLDLIERLPEEESG